MNTYAIDFETYYDEKVSVTTMGPVNYADALEKQEIFLLSVAGSDGFRWVGDPFAFDWPRLNGHLWVSHNAGFDSEIFRRVVELGGCPPDCGPSDWECTADLAAFSGSPRSLKAAAGYWLGEAVVKDIRSKMKGRMLADLSGGEADEFLRYGMSDAEHCLALWEHLSDAWPYEERMLSWHTRELCRHGVGIDMEMLGRGVADLDGTLVGLSAQIPWLAVDGLDELSRTAFAAECLKSGIPVPASQSKVDPAYLAWEEEHAERFGWIRAVRDWRSANAVSQRLKNIRDRTMASGRLNFGLKYFGAHTGRWSGDNAVNVQNLPSAPMFGADIRGMLKPDDGHVFVVCDLAQIEPRVLLWLADDKAALAEIARGASVYEVHARNTMGWRGEYGTMKSGDPNLYKLAKARVLGAGYGAGGVRFVAIAKAMANLDLDEAGAIGVVKSFRASNPRITAFWRTVESGLTRSLGEDFEVVLPSGRSMVYRGVDNEAKASIVKRQGFMRDSFWGGKLTENVTQAVARDVFAHGILECARRGLDVVFHVHDEIIVQVPEDSAGECRREIEDAMTTRPSWAEGLPLGAESHVVARYGKL